MVAETIIYVLQNTPISVSSFHFPLVKCLVGNSTSMTKRVDLS